MEDSQAYNFVVKSQIHDYSVEFINDLQTTLKNELIEGDFIIIDNKIINLYNNLISKTLVKHKYIGIDSSEPQKSYQEITPIIENLINLHLLIGQEFTLSALPLNLKGGDGSATRAVALLNS